ncbi:hypothetical protein V493_06136 [Pseudogymnoascus sp. VKM F-4281 (FW-2241)]|nr:hypothetical protein V493_06136 [Pseudogymnoascus sp. VKM F-4281 (FW-2241)]
MPISFIGQFHFNLLYQRNSSYPNPHLPITPLGQQLGQLIQRQRILLIKPTQHGTVDIQHRNNLSVDQQRDDNLALRRAVAGNVVRERLDVVNDLDCLVGGRVAAHAAREGDGLAGNLAVEGAEDELGGSGAVENVEALCQVLVGLRERAKGEGAPVQLTSERGAGRDL